MPRVLLSRPRQFVAGTPAAQAAQTPAPAPRPASFVGNDMRPRPTRPAAAPGLPARPRTNLSALAVAAAVAQPEPAPAPVTPPSGLPVSRLPIDMELPGAESHSYFELKHRVKWRGVRRVMARTAAVALVILITFGGLLFSQSYLKLHKVFKGGTATAAALKDNVDPNLLKGEGSGRVNILLMGRGGGNHDGPDLTDSMMLVSVDPVNHTSTLLSLPRDLWVNVTNAGVMKLNAVWESGEFQYLGKTAPGSTNPKAITAGFTMVDQTVSQILGINVDYNVLVDFQAFQQAVDSVGGVTVNVPTDLVDPTMAWENSGNSTLAKAGLDNFDGAQALRYVRSRETSSDFARADRQRAVLVALKNKIETVGTLSNPFKISGLLNSFGDNVQTDLSLSNAERLYSIVRNIGSSNISSIDLDGGTANAVGVGAQYVTGGTVSGQSVVLPKAGLFDYGDIQQFVREQLKDPYILKENARIFVLNGTTTPGLATSVANDLKTYGYNVTKVGNTPSTNWPNTTLVDLTHGKDKYTKHYLEDRFAVAADTSLSDTTIPTNGADFVIIIGNDEASVISGSQTQAH